MSLVNGCGSQPKVITEYKTVEIVRTKQVEVEKELTEPVELINLPENFLNMSRGDRARAAGVAFSLQRTRAEQCNGKLFEISRLGVNQGN